MFAKLVKDIKDSLAADNCNWWTDNRGVVIMLQDSKDWNRSRNGGEYAYYRVFSPNNQGGITAYDDWSADFDREQWLGGNDIQYPQAINLNMLVALVQVLSDKSLARDVKEWR